jgi:hypothetical protein
MPADEDAPDLATANKMVVNDFQTYLEQIKNARAVIPPGSTKAIIEKVKNLQYLTNFHSNLNEKIVQADFSFSGTVVQGTSVNSAGDTWRLKFRIDADVPPPGSEQKPHIGYEISLNGVKRQVGHKFVTSLTTGRPGLGVGLVECHREESQATLPNGDKMEWSFVCWKLP